MVEDLYIIIDGIPWYFALSIILTSGILAVALLNFYLNHIKSEESDIYIRQRFETEVVIKQKNRIDIDLYLYAENRGDLAGKVVFGTITGKVTFRGPQGEITVDSSKLHVKKSEIEYRSSKNGLLPPGHSTSLDVRLTFPESGRMEELLLQYEEVELPWYFRVTEGSGDYEVTGTSIIKNPL